MLHFPPNVLVQYLDANLGVNYNKGKRVRLNACPWCGRDRPAYVFNLETQRYRCYRCGQKADLFQLVDKITSRYLTVPEMLKEIYGGSSVWGLEFSTHEEGKAFEDYWSGFKEDYKELYGMPTNYSCDFTSPEGQQVWAYAMKRNIPLDYLRTGEVGWAAGSMRYRLVFLSLEHQKVVYWFGRAIYNWVTPKVLYPSTDVAGRGKDDVVFGIDTVQEGDDVACCEGGISALSARQDGWKSVATLGNEISYIQAAKLAGKKPRQIVFLVEDGITKQHAAAQCGKLCSFGLTTKIGKLTNGDTNDDPTQFPSVVANAEVVTPYTGWFQ